MSGAKRPSASARPAAGKPGVMRALTPLDAHVHDVLYFEREEARLCVCEGESAQLLSGCGSLCVSAMHV